MLAYHPPLGSGAREGTGCGGDTRGFRGRQLRCDWCGGRRSGTSGKLWGHRMARHARRHVRCLSVNKLAVLPDTAQTAVVGRKRNAQRAHRVRQEICNQQGVHEVSSCPVRCKTLVRKSGTELENFRKAVSNCRQSSLLCRASFNSAYSPLLELFVSPSAVLRFLSWAQRVAIRVGRMERD